MMTPEQEKLVANPVRSHQLNLALLNHGVQAGTRFILTAAHTEEDIDYTVDAYEKAFTELREIGLL
jgi:glutamate-1-semialdehyde aminotransferase